MMRVGVIGAGAIGGHIIARLVRAGVNVGVLARGRTLERIRALGIIVVTPEEELRVFPTATDDAAALGPQDLVVIAVKAVSLPAIAPQIAALLGPRSDALFIGNGIPWWYARLGGLPDRNGMTSLLDPADALWRTVGASRLAGGVIYSSCTAAEPGCVHVTSRHDRMIIGRPSGAPGAALEALAELLTGAGLAVTITADLRRVVWHKLMGNMASGLLGILTRAPAQRFLAEPACIALTRAVLAETAAIAGAAGCAVDFDTSAFIARASASPHRASILQDVERGRPAEIDAQFRAPLAIARLCGVATPTLDWLVPLAALQADADP